MVGFHHKTIHQPPVARFLLNPNVPPLFSLAVNSFEFLPCDGTPQAECFYIWRSQSLILNCKALIVDGVGY